MMSKHPFFNLHIDILGQIMQIYKFDMLERSKKITFKDTEKGIDSIDVSFSTQMRTDLSSITEMPDMIPQVKQFITILSDIKLDWIIEQNLKNPRIEIDFSLSHISCSIPTDQHSHVRQASLFYASLFFQMLPNINTLLEILACVLSDSSVIVISPQSDGQVSQTVQMCLVSSVVNCLKLLIHPLVWIQTSITIVPYELIDILDAPMPYIVGILNEHWSEFAQNCQDMDFMTDKCVLLIKEDNTI
jgi:hypothetical protein